MAKPMWYYKAADQEFGPVSGADLKRLADSGKLRPGDAIRREDMQNWTLANRIKGLFENEADSDPDQLLVANVVPLDEGASAKPKESVEAAPSNDNLQKPNGLGNRLFANVKRVAVLTAMHAQIKQLEWDASKADESLGAKAHAALIGKEQFAGIYEAIKKIDDEIVRKKALVPTEPAESVAGRAARLANEAKAKIAIESLLSARKSQVRKLGENIRSDNSFAGVTDLADTLRQAHEAIAKVAAQKSEIQTISSQSPLLMKRVLIGAGIIGVLISAYWSFSLLFGGKGQNVDVSSITRRAAVAAAKIESEREELRRKREVAAAERESQRLVDAKRTELEAEQRKAKMDLEDEQRKAKMDLEDEQRKAKAEEEAQQRKAKNAAELAEQIRRKNDEDRKRRLNSESQLIAAQKERERLAESHFGRIVLDPAKTVQVSRSLQGKNIGASVELRGPKFKQIEEFHRKKEWLPLINILSDGGYTELPDASIIESSVNRLMTYEFTMLLKTASNLSVRPGLRVDPNRTLGLYLISFPLNYEYAEVVKPSNQWQRHPDGIGYLHKWRPGDGLSVVVLAPYEMVRKKVIELNQNVAQKTKEMTTKLELGEIDEATRKKEIKDAVSRVYESAVAWAMEL